MILSRQSERCICCHVSGNLSQNIKRAIDVPPSVVKPHQLKLSTFDQSLVRGLVRNLLFSRFNSPVLPVHFGFERKKKPPPSPYAAEIFLACPSFHGDVRLSVVYQSGFCCPWTIRPSARQPVIRASHRGKSFIIAPAYAMRRLLQLRQT